VAQPTADPIPAETSIPDGAAVTVERLIDLARRHHPVRELIETNLRSADAGVLQARAWQNPELELEMGTARVRVGTDREGIGSVSIRQPFEWPSQRSSRITAAGLGRGVAEAEAHSSLLELEADVRQAVAMALFRQDALAQAQVVRKTSQELYGVVERRVAAGEVGQADLLRVRIEDTRAAQAIADRERDLALARLTLAARCGNLLPATYSITPSKSVEPRPLAESQALADQHHPRLIHLRTLINQRQAEVRRERSAAAPELSIAAFGERESDVDNVGIGVGIEIPLWNRNQGGIAGAHAAVSQVQAQLAVARLEVGQMVAEAWSAFHKAQDRSQRYRNDLQPTAQEALRLALALYQNGESGMLELLDARRTAQEVDEQTIEATAEAQSAAIQLQRAIGTFHPGETP
jgi:cobalt-zinc-cadmium efflux system outer membrane protein